MKGAWKKSNFANLTAAKMAKFASDNKDSFAGADTVVKGEFQARWKKVCKKAPFPFAEDGSFVEPKKVETKPENKSDTKAEKTVNYTNTYKGTFVLPGIEFGAAGTKEETQPVSKELADSKKFKHAVTLKVLVKA